MGEIAVLFVCIFVSLCIHVFIAKYNPANRLLWEQVQRCYWVSWHVFTFGRFSQSSNCTTMHGAFITTLEVFSENPAEGQIQSRVQSNPWVKEKSSKRTQRPYVPISHGLHFLCTCNSPYELSDCQVMWTEGCWADSN